MANSASKGDDRTHQHSMRWKGQHVRDEARLRDRLWQATAGEALPERPIRQTRAARAGRACRRVLAGAL